MTYRVVANYVPSGRLAIVEEWESDRIANRRERKLNKEIRAKYRKLGQASPIWYRVIYSGSAWDGWKEDRSLVAAARGHAIVRVASRKINDAFIRGFERLKIQ